MKKILPLLVFVGLIALAGFGYFQFRSGTAPQSRFVLMDGAAISTTDLRGKVILVNFWATSCTTCVAEMPALIATHERYQSQGYDTVAVAMRYDPPNYVANFVQSRKLPFKVALDNTGDIARAWGDIRLTPTTFLLDKSGRIVKTYVGAPNMRELHGLIEQLLKA